MMVVGLVILLVTLLALPLGVLVVLRIYARRGPINPALACGRCRYPLAGVLAPRCPECGVDLAQAGAIPPGVRLPRRLPLALWMLQSVIVAYVIVIASVMMVSAIPGARERDYAATRSVTFADAALPPLTIREVLRTDPFVKRYVVKLSMTDAPASGTMSVDMLSMTWQFEGAPPEQGLPTREDLLAWWTAGAPATEERLAALSAHADNVEQELARMSRSSMDAVATRIEQGISPEFAASQNTANSSINMANGPSRWFAGAILASALIGLIVALVRRLASKRNEFPPKAKTVPWVPGGA